MKWIALALIVLGIALFWHGATSGRESSFNDGTFLLQIIEIMAGFALFAGGIGWLIVLGFLALT